MSRLHMILTVLALGTAVGGCGRSVTPYETGQPAAAALTVRVVNDNFNDVDVYAVSEGVVSRVGMVTGNSDATFVLNPSFFPTGQLRLLARPIGGRGRASSGLISVVAGETVEFDISPSLGGSAVFVH